MTRTRKIAFLVATLLLVLGLLIGGFGLLLMGFDLRNLDSGGYHEVETEITEEFDSVEIDTSTANIRFAASEDGTCRVVCYENEKIPHSAKVTDGVLTIFEEDNRAWYEHIGFYNRSTEIVVYVPRTTFAALEISASTGDVTLKGLHFGELSIRLSTGDITLTDIIAEKMTLGVSTGDVTLSRVTAGSLDISATTGDISVGDTVVSGAVEIQTTTGDVSCDILTADTLAVETDTGEVMLTDTVAEGSLTVLTDTGDVTLTRVDAGEIGITTDTGDVVGTLRSGKLFTTSTDTGDVSVPAHDPDGEPCSITTDTGDIDIRIAG